MYKLTHFETIVRLSDGANIPPDPANRDYAEYLEWLAAGNIPQAADPIPVYYAIMPEMPLAAVGQAVTITIYGEPGSTSLLVDGVSVPLVIGEAGIGAVEFIPDTAGEYVLKGSEGELANKRAVIKAVD